MALIWKANTTWSAKSVVICALRMALIWKANTTLCKRYRSFILLRMALIWKANTTCRSISWCSLRLRMALFWKANTTSISVQLTTIPLRMASTWEANTTSGTMAWRLGLQPRRGCGWWGAFSLPHIVASLQCGVTPTVTARAVNITDYQMVICRFRPYNTYTYVPERAATLIFLLKLFSYRVWHYKIKSYFCSRKVVTRPEKCCILWKLNATYI